MYLLTEVVFYSGRRERLPAGGYRPDALFDGRKDYWDITFLDLPVEAFDVPTLAAVQFSFQDRHYQEAAPGQSFAIMEGPHKVEEGKIISIECDPKQETVI